MLDRFTDEARRVLGLAQEEVRTLYHNHIGSTHLLLGLLREGGGVAAQVLDRLGVAPEQIRRELGDVMVPRQPATAGRPPRRWLRRHPRSAEAGVDEWAESGEWLEPWPIEHVGDSAWEALAAARRVARDRPAREIAPVTCWSVSPRSQVRVRTSTAAACMPRSVGGSHRGGSGAATTRRRAYGTAGLCAVRPARDNAQDL